MKKLLFILTNLLFIQFGYSQVGINTTTPNAQLDIKSTNQVTPANTDGILMPKIDAFPLTNPTAAQQGMMVYLTTVSAGKQPGFYYWDNTGIPQWKSVAGTGTTDHDFYEVATTTPPDAITDNIFHTGNVGIGNNNPTYKLDVDETASGKIYALRVRHSNAIDGSITSGIQSDISGSFSTGVIQGFSTAITPGSGTVATGLRNIVGGSSTADAYGVNNNISTSGSGSRTGVNNSFPGTGTGISYGMLNSFSNPNAISLGIKSSFTASGIRDKTGVDNVISNSTGGFHTGISNTFTNNNGAVEETGVFSQFTGSSVGNIRGIYNEITNSGSGNIHYGLYNNINGSGGLKRYGVENILSGTSTSEEYGVENNISTSGGNRTHYGVRNYLSGSGTGFRIGTDNWISGSGNGDQYGVNNYIDNSGTGIKYGVYNYIPPATNGLHYGVYSNAIKANSYAGYFLGRMSIGTTTANNYILPLSRGTVNQIMQTDAAGNVTWQNPNTALNNFAWTTTGNSGTDPTLNFIGTTDNNDVVFHRDIIEAGRIGMNDTSFGRGSLRYNTGTRNTAIGNSALSGFITGFNEGNDNTAIGFQTLMSNTFGSSNVALGSNALQTNKSASKNIAIGTQALYEQNFTNGGTAYDTDNVAIGFQSLYNTNGTTNTNGRGNIGIGSYALSNNGTGNFNIALGNSALGATGASGGAMTGNSNVAIGYAAIKSNITGTGNVAMGSLSLNYNILGDNNVSIGNDALFYSRALSNGTAIGTKAMLNYGISGTVGINDNVAVGYEALKGATCCPIYNQNTAVGYQSLTTNSANNNTANGFQSLFSNATGTANTAIGNEALRTNISGSNNIAIGNQAGFSETGSNKLYIENSNSTTPLIYGEFNNDLLRFHGNLEIDNITTFDNKMQVVNKNNYQHSIGNQIFGSGGDDFIISSKEGASETAGIYGDGNAVTIWSAGDANGLQPAALVYFLDEDNFDASNTNPYDASSVFPNPVALKSYITPAGAYLQVSDKNKKENIVKIENATEKINQISGYTYQFKLAPEEIKKGDKPILSSGVLAQEVNKILPQAVQKNQKGDYFVDYAAITPLLIEAIKEQNAKIKTLETMNSEILKRLEKLETK
jgi:trimeric autotransporter adhesin